MIFGPAGHAYVYSIYGRYFCMNITCEIDGLAGCVLLRALEPVAGIHLMAATAAWPPARRTSFSPQAPAASARRSASPALRTTGSTSPVRPRLFRFAMTVAPPAGHGDSPHRHQRCSRLAPSLCRPWAQLRLRTQIFKPNASRPIVFRLTEVEVHSNHEELPLEILFAASLGRDAGRHNASDECFRTGAAFRRSSTPTRTGSSPDQPQSSSQNPDRRAGPRAHAPMGSPARH